jgi:hypothetical protein
MSAQSAAKSSHYFHKLALQSSVFKTTSNEFNRREKVFFCRKARKNAQNSKTIIKLFFALFAFLRQ